LKRLGKVIGRRGVSWRYPVQVAVFSNTSSERSL
jgi:hypothetical protein